MGGKWIGERVECEARRVRRVALAIHESQTQILTKNGEFQHDRREADSIFTTFRIIFYGALDISAINSSLRRFGDDLWRYRKAIKKGKLKKGQKIVQIAGEISQDASTRDQ